MSQITEHSTAHTQTHEALTEALTTRKAMLAELHDSIDPVIEAQRFSIECVVDEVRAALARLERGTYGTCVGCGVEIPAERLELRPWAAFCVRCAAR